VSQRCEIIDDGPRYGGTILPLDPRGGGGGGRGGGGQQGPTGPWVDPSTVGDPPPPPWNCGVNPITNNYGFNNNPTGQLGDLRPGVGGNGAFGSRGGAHKGIDIAAPVGTPVHANRDGVVDKVLTGYAGGYGNSVSIKHSDTAYTSYSHLRDAPTLQPGNSVSQGDVIGYSGRTGNPPASQPASEDHLHFMFKNSQITFSKGEKFNDPAKYLNSPCPQ
jgi:murein DD-endopeptidase MepM/ murein hydrolase activator NlpD